MRRAVSSLLCAALVLPGIALPCYAYADDIVVDEGAPYEAKRLESGGERSDGDRSSGAGSDDVGLLWDNDPSQIDDSAEGFSSFGPPADDGYSGWLSVVEPSSYSLVYSVASSSADYLTDEGISTYSITSGGWAGGLPALGGFSGSVSGLSGAATNLLGAAYGGRNNIPTISGLDDYQTMVFGIGRLVSRVAVEIDAVYDAIQANTSRVDWLNSVMQSGFNGFGTSTGWLSGSWSGDTLSPGQLLGSIYNRSYSIDAKLGNLVTSSSINGYSDANRNVATVSAIIANQLRTNYSLTNVTEGYHSVATIAGLIYNRAHSINNNMVTSLAMDGLNEGSYSVGTVSALIYNQAYRIKSQLGNLVTSVSVAGLPDASRSVATLSALIAGSLRTSYGMTGVSDGVYSAGTVLALIYNKAYDINSQLGNLVTSSSISGYADASRSVATVSAIIANQLRTSYSMTGVTEGPHSVATVLALIYNKVAGINSAMDGLSVDVDLPALDVVYAKLDGIMDLMRLGLAVDVADAILGDLDFSALSALTADVAGALDSAFPFCVPALLKQVLGLVQADPSPPSFHFEVMGAPLDFDFSGYQGLADVTGWVCRLTLVFVLLAASPRFVVSSRAGGA